MIGAIIGDIAGSRFEWRNRKTKEFQLFHENCRPTDDSVMSLAVAEAILACQGDYEDLSEKAIASMQRLVEMQPLSIDKHTILRLFQTHKNRMRIPLAIQKIANRRPVFSYVIRKNSIHVPYHILFPVVFPPHKI